MSPTRRSARLKQTTRAVASPGLRGSPRKRKAKKHRTPPPQQHDDPMDTDSEPSPGETNPAKVNRPVTTAIHGNLKNAWRINKALPMCFIFDYISPAHRFKRGMPFDEEAVFPEGNSGDVTETDADPPGLMPIMPKQYR
jgi:hypothetical protein